MESNGKEQVMERRFAVRYEELMAEAEVKPEALEGVLKRLDEFVKPFAASLKHDAQRQHAAEYVAGLVSNVKRKNIETIAYLHEQDRQPMQKFIGQKPWEGEPMIDELVRQVGASIGRADGVLVIDPSGVLKQGKASVGVARQWCGRAGKVDNCQVGVYMAYVARDEHALVDARLYLPKEWTKDKKTVQASGNPQGDQVSHAARACPGNDSQASRGVAARLGDRGRRNGPKQRFSR